MKRTLCFLVFLISINSYALIDINKISVGNDDKNGLAIGSRITLTGASNDLNGDGIFLGSAVNPSKESTYKIILNSKNETVFFVNSNNFNKKMREENILDLYEQAGGTCSAYAINNFLHQWNLFNSKQNLTIAERLNTEEGRTQVLAEAIHEYYLNLKRQYSINGILNGFGKKMGFKCSKASFEQYDDVKEFLLGQLEKKIPVIISFNIGPKMYEGPFKFIDNNDQKREIDQRLWLPRKVGERNSGGHSIVAAASFEFMKKTYLLMIDSDWTEPRIWDLEEYLNQKTALSEIEFISCR